MVEYAQIHRTVGREIAYADGADFACRLIAFQRTPCTVHIAVGLMNQHHVYIAQIQAGKRTFQRGGCGFFACVFHPHFGGYKQFFPRHAAAGNAAPHFAFVHISLRGVDVAVARSDGVDNGLLGLFGRNLVHAEAEYGDWDAVGQLDGCMGNSLIGFGKIGGRAV